jgi:hypothetical protein
VSRGNQLPTSTCRGNQLRLLRSVRLQIAWQRVGLADEVGSDAIPDAAGGERGHEAARLHAVIHRYVFYPNKYAQVKVGQ